MQWTFENYRLDTDNAALWKGDEQIVLRPKTFDVLRYLVEHAGELVRKETLLETVWEGSYVVEGVLTTSMSELRKIFGDTAKNQRYIATVYRRGYRFIAPVSSPEQASKPVSDDTEISISEATRSDSMRQFPGTRGFVGREQECDRLVQKLTEDSECRILSLIGPGGIGKTRLALALTRRLSELEDGIFSDGFYFVRLQSIDSGDDIFSVIADVLDLRYSGGESLEEHIHGFLENKRVLLVLDNFEHLQQHEQALLTMINVAPGLKIIVTSRESLGISEAWYHPVLGLEIEDSKDCDAVRLFARRAKRNQPEFDLDEKLPAVLRVCKLVEGMPLALELAVGWMKMLSIDEIADEIEKGIDILEDQYSGESGRHSSVRAVFNETWERLTDAERTLLKQFSVFRGGAGREAIDGVIGAGLPILARLVNKALLRTNRQLRYRMHELIRQFAEEELARDPEFDRESREKHARFFLEWLGLQVERLRSPEQAESCREIQTSFDNIRVAWRWAVAQGDVDLVAPSIRAVSLFCDLRGHFQDGLALFASALAMVEASDHPEKDSVIVNINIRTAILNLRLSRYETAHALLTDALASTDRDYERALSLRFLGDFHFCHAELVTAEQARQYLNESADLCEKLGNVQLQVECLDVLAFLHMNLITDVEASQRYSARAVELARQAGRPESLANALDVYAWIANHRGKYEEAEKVWREVYAIAHESGNRSQEALAMNWLGWAAWCVGDSRLEEARQSFTDALERYQELGERANVSMTHADLATVLLEIGELDQARELCQQGLVLAEQIGRDDHYVYNLYVLGAVECAAGNRDAARKHLAKSRKLAWEQEEQTNKPVVVYYMMQLLYADFIAAQDEADPSAIKNIVTVLIFLQVYPATWQAFKDRAGWLQREIEGEYGSKEISALSKLPDDEITRIALELIPGLLDRQDEAIAS